MKSRASRYSLPLVLGGACALVFLIFTHIRPAIQPATRIRLDSRQARTASHPPGNGVSLLLSSEDELIAEDDLFWEHYVAPKYPSREEIVAEEEFAAHQLDVQERDQRHALRALTYWLAEGGVFPRDWEVPSDTYLKKIGGRGVEKLLGAIEERVGEEPIFADGWAHFAKETYKTVVFSKVRPALDLMRARSLITKQSYCPYSRKAKAVLETYKLSPAPFIVELDQRSELTHTYFPTLNCAKPLSSVADTSSIQTLLQRLTGRRTVPNILLDFTSIGGSDEVTLLHSEGGLRKQFEQLEILPGSRQSKSNKKLETVLEIAEPETQVAEQIHFDSQGVELVHEEPRIDQAWINDSADRGDSPAADLPDDNEDVHDDDDDDNDVYVYDGATPAKPMNKRAGVPANTITERLQPILAREPTPQNPPVAKRMVKAPNPRQVTPNGAAALVAAAKIRKTRM